MTPLERITERANRNGDVNDPAVPRPLVTLEEFFEGNSTDGSICCNCTPTPEAGQVYDILKRIRARRDVADVLVEITMFDTPEWPYSDTVWVITTADPEDIRSCFPESMAPDEVWVGWRDDVPTETVDVPEAFTPVACWWD